MQLHRVPCSHDCAYQEYGFCKLESYKNTNADCLYRRSLYMHITPQTLQMPLAHPSPQLLGLRSDSASNSYNYDKE